MTVIEARREIDPGLPPEQPLEIVTTRTKADRVFRAMAVGSGATVLLIMGLIVLFLTVEAWPALKVGGLHFFTDQIWRPDSSGHRFGVAGVITGSVLIAAIALFVAVPASIATALCINEYAPVRARRSMIALVDLLAALPSLIYGLWGKFFLQPKLNGLADWLTHHLGFIPLFRTNGTAGFGSSMFVAGLVVAIMILPIVTSVSREVLAQVPRDHCEAAYALGGSRWAMIREVVLPFGRSGIIGGAMLGLGRALGETIAVAIILSPNYLATDRVLQPGGGSVASLIVLKFGEAREFGQHALIAAGLSLFVLTLAVNMVARFIVSRSVSSRGLVS